MYASCSQGKDMEQQMKGRGEDLKKLQRRLRRKLSMRALQFHP